MKVEALDTKLNKMKVANQNSIDSENSVTDLGEEFSELVGQYFSGANLDSSATSLDIVQKAALFTGELKLKVKEEKKEVSRVEDQKVNNNETENHDETQVQENKDQEDSEVDTNKDTNQEVVRAVDTSVVKSNELKLKEDSFENTENVDTDVVKQIDVHSEEDIFAENTNATKKSNSKLSNKQQEKSQAELDAASQDTMQGNVDEVTADQAIRQVAARNIKRGNTQGNRELSEEEQVDKQEVQGAESIFTKDTKSGASLGSGTSKDSAQNVSAQLLRALSASEFSGQKNFTKSSNSQSNLDLAGINASTALDKVSSGKIKQTLANLLPRYSEKTLEKVKELLAKATQNRDGNSLTLKLDPQDLGQITVKVTQRDNNVYARIIPESSEVETMLRQRAGELSQVLTQAGFKADQLHISFGQERSESESFKFNEFMDGQYNPRQNGQFSDKSSVGEMDNPVFKNTFNSEVKIDNIDLGWVA